MNTVSWVLGNISLCLQKKILAYSHHNLFPDKRWLCVVLKKALGLSVFELRFAIHKPSMFTLLSLLFLSCISLADGTEMRTMRNGVWTQKPENQGCSENKSLRIKHDHVSKLWKQNDQNGCRKQRTGEERACRYQWNSFFWGHSEESGQRCFCPEREVSSSIASWYRTKNGTSLSFWCCDRHREMQLERRKLPLAPVSGSSFHSHLRPLCCFGLAKREPITGVHAGPCSAGSSPAAAWEERGWDKMHVTTARPRPPWWGPIPMSSLCPNRKVIKNIWRLAIHAFTLPWLTRIP